MAVISFIKYYKEKSLFYNWCKELYDVAVQSIFIEMLVVALLGIITKKIPFLFTLILTILNLISFIIILICKAKKTCILCKKTINYMSPVKSVSIAIRENDKIMIIDYLVRNNLFEEKKINILMEEVYRKNELPRTSEKLTLLLVIGYFIELAIFVAGSKDLELALKKASTILLINGAIYIILRIINSDFQFFKEYFALKRNKLNDLQILYEILNDILLTEDFNTNYN